MVMREFPGRSGKKLRRGYVIKLSFIGMSGAGKSHWAQKLKRAGFRAISIDDHIEGEACPGACRG